MHRIINIANAPQYSQGICLYHSIVESLTNRKAENANNKLHKMFAPTASAICFEPIASSVQIEKKE